MGLKKGEGKYDYLIMYKESKILQEKGICAAGYL